MPHRGGVARVRNAAPGALRRGGAAALQQRSEPLLAKGLFPAGTLKYAGHGSLRAAHWPGRTDAAPKVAGLVAARNAAPRLHPRDKR